MDTQWFILVEGKPEGPLTFQELVARADLTPETFVWEEGRDDWIRAKKVKRLKKVFSPEDSKDPETDLKKPELPEELPLENGVLVAQGTPPSPYLWLLLLLAALLFFIARLYW